MAASPNPMSGIPLTPHGDPDWFIVEEGFDLAREHEVESILTICNGYLGIRASIAEGRSLSRPSTFVADCLMSFWRDEPP
jgi:trehalose/maltose hydrolase-like predicted phosphorylase